MNDLSKYIISFILSTELSHYTLLVTSYLIFVHDLFVIVKNHRGSVWCVYLRIQL